MPSERHWPRWEPCIRRIVYAICAIASGAGRSIAQQQPGGVSETPLPATCRETAPLVRIADAWSEAEDSVAMQARGLPSLAGYDPQETRFFAARGSVRDHLRSCLERLAPIPAHGLTLLDMVRNRLALQDDAGAWTLTQQYLHEVDHADAHAPFVADPEWARMLALNDYAWADPPRWTVARRLEDELDRNPSLSLAYRLLVHQAMMRAAELAEADTILLRETGAIMALWGAHKTEVETRFANKLNEALAARAGVLLRSKGFSMAQALIDSVYGVLAAQGRVPMFMERLRAAYAVYGTQAPPIQATVWFQTADSGRSVRPAKGKVTLILNARYLEWRSTPFSDPNLTKLYVCFRTLLTKYAAQGLELVTVDETQYGFLETLYEDPAAETEQRRHYYLDLHHIPGSYAVYHVTDWRQLADGSWRHKPSPQTVGYPMDFILVDREGKIIYGADQIALISEPRLTDMVVRALAVGH